MPSVPTSYDRLRNHPFLIIFTIIQNVISAGKGQRNKHPLFKIFQSWRFFFSFSFFGPNYHFSHLWKKIPIQGQRKEYAMYDHESDDKMDYSSMLYTVRLVLHFAKGSHSKYGWMFLHHWFIGTASGFCLIERD